MNGGAGEWGAGSGGGVDTEEMRGDGRVVGTDLGCPHRIQMSWLRMVRMQSMCERGVGMILGF